MNKQNEKMLRTMDVKKLLVKLSVPAFIGMAVNALYNLVDTIFVGRGVNELAIGGLAFAFPIQMILFAIGLMIGIGAASVFSRAFGKKDYEKMSDVVNTAIRLDIVLAITFSLISYFFLNELLVYFGATSENMVYAYDYLSIIVIGLVPQTLSMVFNNLTRAEGRSRVSMYALVIAAGTNILLDPIFIFGFGWGVKGAAIATVIAQFVGLIYIFLQALSPKSNLRIKLDKWLHIDFDVIKEIVVIGFPTFLRNSLGAFVAIIIYKLINQYGGSEPGIYISIFGVINRIIGFVFLPSFGIVQGMNPIVGFNFGAGLYKRVKDVIMDTIRFVLIYFVSAFVLIQIFSSSIFKLFSNTGNEIFIDYGGYAFRIISFGFLLVGFQIVVSAVFQALGYPIRAMIVALSRQVVFFIPLVYALTFYFSDMKGIWYAFAGADILSGLISIGLMYFELKIIHQRSLDGDLNLISESA